MILDIPSIQISKNHPRRFYFSFYCNLGELKSSMKRNGWKCHGKSGFNDYSLAIVPGVVNFCGWFCTRTAIVKWFRRTPSRGATVLSRIPCRESVQQEIRDSWVGIGTWKFLLITLSPNRYQKDQFRPVAMGGNFEQSVEREMEGRKRQLFQVADIYEKVRYEAKIQASWTWRMTLIRKVYF